MANRPNGADDPDHTEVVRMGSALGWGGVVVGPDGSTAPTPEHEALAAAIPQWVQAPEHVDDAVAVCLDVVTRSEANVRIAAVSAFAAIASRYARLPREQAVRQALARALEDPDHDVRVAATAARKAIDQALGT